jgi:serine/threonine protein kinase
MVVAVRRLSEDDATWKLKEFESEVEAIGRVHHPNIARLRAYYFAHDEKLLVSDFIRNGSLYSALHGNISLILLAMFMSFCIEFNIGPLHTCKSNVAVFGHTIF